MIAAPIGHNQLRPSMSVTPNGITLSTSVGNPVGGTQAMYYPPTGGVYPIVQSTNQPVGSGGLSLGTMNWTLESWGFATQYPPAGVNYQYIIEITHGGPSFTITSSGYVLGAQSFVTNLCTSSIQAPLNQWVHYAFVRNGTSLALYLNGTNRGGTTISSTAAFDQDPAYNVAWVGNGSNAGNPNPWKGYMCEARISSVARYTANFTPQTKPFVNDVYTLLLVHGDAANGSSAISDDNT